MSYFDVGIRVRYAETDQMGVCYYGNYFVWFEVARTEFFRNIGLQYTDFERDGIYLPVRSASCDYRKPLRYDDEIIVRIFVKAVNRTSIEFYYEIYKKGVLSSVIASGNTVHVFVNEGMKPQRVPDIITERLKALGF